MKGQSVYRRLASVLLTGLFTLGMVMGSVLLSEIDPAMVVESPTRSVTLPTSTLYPTLSLETPALTPEPVSSPTSSPTPASPLVEQCTPPAGWLPHEVKADETLLTLAWFSHTSVYELMEANCLDTTEIRPGTILYLPPATQATPTPYHCEGPPPSWRVIYVQAGDTLYSLAVRYGTTIEAIRRANCLVDYTVYIGQPLYLPPVIVVMPTFTPWPPTLTPTASATPTPEATHTPTLIPTLPFTPTLTPTAPVTPTVTPTTAPTVVPTVTPTVAPTVTSTVVPPTSTPTVTPTPDAGSITPTITATPSPSLTPTASPVSSPTPTSTNSPAPTSSPSSTDTSVPPSPTLTPTPSG